jgi:catechol 2,3-dioxygenase-like lactoylglutathione lyase family enzyme
MRLHGAMLFVKDLGRMTAFYSEVLGLTPNQDTQLDEGNVFALSGGLS